MADEMKMEDNNEMYEWEGETVILDVNGKEEEFALLDRFTLEDKEYVCLALIQDDVLGDDDILFRVHKDPKTGEEIVTSIDDDEEFDKVIEAYEERVKE